MSGASFQARRDRVLRSELEADRGVQLAVRKLGEAYSGFGLQARRRLLSRSVRLTKSIAPEVHEALQACRERLGFERPVELYVEAQQDFQAFCAWSVSAPLLIGVSSRLLEGFSPAELRFVLGHELGHAALDHFGIPMPRTATFEDVGGRFVDRATQLKLYVWCRAAEISADRAGLLCAQDAQESASALFKLASGVATSAIRTDLEAFASQLDALIGAPAACHKERYEEHVLDCFDTHPYSPLRVQALLAYARTGAHRADDPLAGARLALDDVEDLVERDLGLMEPTYLEDPTDEARELRRTLYCAGICVAAVDGNISDLELRALRALLGAKNVDAPEKLDEVRKELDERLAQARSRDGLTRAQLVQHATIVAAADGVIEPLERESLERIASALDVDPRVIDQTLAGAAAPMD